MTVREFVRVIWDGKWYVVAAVAIVMTAAFVYLERQTPEYQATASVKLNTAQGATGGEGAGSAAAMANPDPAVVTSRDVAEAATKELGLSATQAPALAAIVAPTFEPDSNVMLIVGTAADPAVATSAANAFATAYTAHLPSLIADQVAALDKRVAALRSQLSEVNAALQKDPKDSFASAKRTSVNQQMASLAGQEVTLTSISPVGQVLEHAAGAVPTGTNRETVLALSLLAGLAAGIGLALIRKTLDVHLRTATQAAEAAGVGVLAEIDGVRVALKDATHQQRLPVASRAATPYTESIRELRTALQVGVAGQAHVAFVVTAADPSAPRSFLTANLAASWALSGRRTVVLSADMRQPMLESLLPPPAEWEGGSSGLRPTQVPNLSIYPVPEQPLDPADFLATAEAHALVDSLRESADILVIDAPPVLAAADATILGSYADRVLLVATLGKTVEVVLAEAAKRLRVNGSPIAGLALVGATGDRRMTYAATYGVSSSTSRGQHAAPTTEHSVEAAGPTPPTTTFGVTEDADTAAERRPPRAQDAESVRTSPDGRTGELPEAVDDAPAPSESSLTVVLPASGDAAAPREKDVVRPAPTTHDHLRRNRRATIKPAWSPVSVALTERATDEGAEPASDRPSAEPGHSSAP